MDDNFEFLDIQRELPDKQNNYQRTSNFNEVYGRFKKENAKSQASRCLDCGNPYCQWKCPVYNFIPDWCKLLSEGRLFEAAEMSHRTNPLPEICGRICPQDRLCEGACTLNSGFGAVSIGELEKYITDTAIKRGWRPNLSNVTPSGKKVAIIGAGPAGLSCADGLCRQGIAPTVYDRHSEIGGLLTFGIPNFKLDKDVVKSRRTLQEQMGVTFILNTEVGKDITIDALMQQYDAVFMGMGAYQAIAADLPGDDDPRVFQALDYLIPINRAQLNHEKHAEEMINFKDERIVVLGGGDTAMDCTRSALRQGATRVTCVYRRDEANMPGSGKDFNNAKEEGVKFLWKKQPIELIPETNHIEIKLVNTELGEKDSSGRQEPKVIPHSEHTIHCDRVVIAFGFNPNPPTWLQSLNIETDSNQRVIAADKTTYPFQTSNEKIFAGGDMVRGSDLVVTAVYEGREAAKAIGKYLCAH